MFNEGRWAQVENINFFYKAQFPYIIYILLQDAVSSLDFKMSNVWTISE